MKKYVYLISGIFMLMVSWFLNHSVILAIIHYLFWPIYLVYCLLTGKFADGGLMEIINHYF